MRANNSIDDDRVYCGYADEIQNCWTSIFSLFRRLMVAQNTFNVGCLLYLASGFLVEALEMEAAICKIIATVQQIAAEKGEERSC